MKEPVLPSVPEARFLWLQAVPDFGRSLTGKVSTVDALLLCVAVAWGSTYWVAKELVNQATVLAVLAVRMALTAPALGVIFAARN